ncbi:tRNA synthetases class I-domain-containing protein [Radiomyces spectabilis]|uniref:tRNA synthetases class I-domain-containing protein n=1 Tax=Radiomyces spectabilis TaxID=64574 RepID=UPI002220E1E0|nr:tRNA synthetases class I-domain-containing protein [Radiomyces spectabilis]KAI8381002.1 tRNA synthetases class I-domain-containing protein [Radiomyces spectabilis]
MVYGAASGAMLKRRSALSLYTRQSCALLCRHGTRTQPLSYSLVSRSSRTDRIAVEKPRKQFSDTYDAKTVEKGWYQWWESQGFFKASSADYYPDQKRGSYTMLTPPPNVTGSLHIGHALTVSIEDCMVRWRRMCGYDVAWIPGTDHAGIGTQSVVEKMLMRERNVTRHDLGREAFVKEIWEWRQKYGDRILLQMRRMGASVDWDQVFFTMDQPRSEAVQNAFIRLFEDGLIYRETRLVNWCCALETVISDIEVDYKEIQGRTLLQLPGRSKGVEFGVLHNFSYPIVDPDPNGLQHLTVSTTRIETMLGDCAVAIHSNDPRYKGLHGKFVRHPILGTQLPIVCDDQLVEMEFGTGVVKVTPAHDPNDYACARRHNLPMVSMFDKLGKLNEHCGLPELVGQDRFDVREIVIKKLQELGCYEGRNDKHAMRVAVCSRSGDIIEPLLQPQWYIRCQELAAASKEKVENGAMQIHPSYHVQEWNRWLDNIQDWCISRQLWWGHEIPAYQIIMDHPQRQDKDYWVVAPDSVIAAEKAQKLLEKEGFGRNTSYQLQKDEDVLDTWFSSGLLPLSALGWKGHPNDPIPPRYPLQLMETGFDILFFWVARMAMLAHHFTGKAPFENVYLHAMVRDSQGRKMSKSLGNVVDPLHVIDGVSLDVMKDNLLHSNLPKKEIATSIKNMEKEYPNGIPACGTDSLRFALVAYTQQTRQINMEMNNVVQTSYFCNKLWNLFKFGLGRLEKEGFAVASNPLEGVNPAHISLANRYILSRMADAVARCQNGFENYRPFEAADALRRFVVEDVCDVYVEFSKTALNKADLAAAEKETTLHILHACMDTSLRLAHPLMPFITEELWQHMKSILPCTHVKSQPPSIMLEAYPAADQYAHLHSEQVESHFKIVLAIIHASRSLRQGHQISVSKELPFIIYCDNPGLVTSDGPLALYAEEIKNLVKASELRILDAKVDSSLEGYTVKAIDDHLKILVPTQAVVRAQLECAAAKGADVTQLVETKKKLLEKKLTKISKEMEKLTARITKSEYTASVPKHIQDKDRQRIKLLILEKETAQNDLKLLNSAFTS